MRIGTKLLLAETAAVTLLLLGFGVVEVRRQVALFDASMRRDQVHLARVIGTLFEHVRLTRGPAAARDIVATVDAHHPDVACRWVSLAGPEAAALPPALRAGLAAGRAAVVGERVGTRDVLSAYVPVLEADTPPVAILVREPLARRDTFVAETWRRIGVLTLSLAATYLLAIAVLEKRILLSRLEELIELARVPGTAPPAPPSADELGQLEGRITSMRVAVECSRASAAREVAGRRAAEHQLRHAERLSSVGRLSAGVAHELGAPLGVISGRAELIEEDPAASLEIRVHAGKIRHQVGRISRMVRQLLDYARQGRAVFRPRRLGEVVDAAVELTALEAAQREVRLGWAGEACDPVVEVDAAQLEQVLVNLLRNAVHATAPGGHVAVELHEQAQAGTVEVRVRDDGAGIAPEDLPHIFDPFFTTKEVGEGTGLGLSVAQGIVHDHGGRLEVTSTPGGGSVFRVVLPRAPGAGGFPSPAT